MLVYTLCASESMPFLLSAVVVNLLSFSFAFVAFMYMTFDTLKLGGCGFCSFFYYGTFNLLLLEMTI